MKTTTCETCFKEITEEEALAAEGYYENGGGMCVNCAIGMYESCLLDSVIEAEESGRIGSEY